MKRKFSLTIGLLVASIILQGQGFNLLTQPTNMHVARYGHSAIHMPNGKVMVIGGHTTGFLLTNTAEIYDPTTDTWTLHNITNPHDMLAMAKLNNGNWMFMGGCNSGYGVGQSVVTTIFNPTTESFATGPNMTRARTNSSAATLSNGNILVVGNWYATGDAELYDASSNQFIAISSVPVERSYPLVLPANDGSAFILGGYGVYGGSMHTQVDYFDPANNTITMHSSEIIASEPGYSTTWSAMYAPVENMRLSDGRYVFMAYKVDNGIYSYRIFIFDPATKTFSKMMLNEELPDYAANQTLPIAHWANMLVNTTDNFIYINSYDAQSSAKEERIYTIDAINGILNAPTAGTGMGYYMGSASKAFVNGNILYTGGTTDGSNFNVSATVQMVTPTNSFYVDDIFPQTKGFLVYPNPVTTSSYQMNLPNEYCHMVNIYDISGILHKSVQIDQGIDQITIEKGSLKPGMYIIEVHHRFGKHSTKVIIQ